LNAVEGTREEETRGRGKAESKGGTRSGDMISQKHFYF
jgi:hypothetical protein